MLFFFRPHINTPKWDFRQKFRQIRCSWKLSLILTFIWLSWCYVKHTAWFFLFSNSDIRVMLVPAGIRGDVIGFLQKLYNCADISWELLKKTFDFSSKRLLHLVVVVDTLSERSLSVSHHMMWKKCVGHYNNQRLREKDIWHLSLPYCVTFWDHPRQGAKFCFAGNKWHHLLCLQVPTYDLLSALGKKCDWHGTMAIRWTATVGCSLSVLTDPV